MFGSDKAREVCSATSPSATHHPKAALIGANGAAVGQCIILLALTKLGGRSSELAPELFAAWLATMTLWAAGEAGFQTQSRRADPANLESSLGAAALLGLLVVCLSAPRVGGQIIGLQVFGIALVAAGAALRCVAVRTLGAEFRASTHRDGALCNWGVYRHVRHPAELGLLMCALGSSLALTSIWGLVFFGFVFAPLSVWRVRREDQALARRDEANYRNYAMNVPAWLPSFV